MKGKTKARICLDCDAQFQTNNNTRRCSSCSRKRFLANNPAAVCPGCQGYKDPRAKQCTQCRTYDSEQMRSMGDRGHAVRWYGADPEPHFDVGGYVLIGSQRQHVLVMEQFLGRKLVKGESVHHRNGVRDDNRLENLELWCRPQPAGIRAADALAWALEIVRRYGAA